MDPSGESKVSVSKPGKLWLVKRDGEPVVATASKEQATKRARKISAAVAATSDVQKPRRGEAESEPAAKRRSRRAKAKK